MSAVRPLARRALVIALGALCFLTGGIVVPQFVSATVSSGERASFFPLPPARVLDTRFGPSPIAVGTKVGAGQTIDVQLAGVGGVPASAGAVVLNLTAANPSAQSLLVAFPTGTTRPTASSLNFLSGQIVPNAVTVKLGTGGKVSIYNDQGTVDVIADVNGYYENVNFDDRYDTKAQGDAKNATAITTPNHVGSAQVADGSISSLDVQDNSIGSADVLNNTLTGLDLKDGTLTLNDLTGGGVLETAGLGSVTVLANSCTIDSVDLGVANAGRLLLPVKIGIGVAGSSFVSTYPVVLNVDGQATIQICNRARSAFVGANVVVEYELI